MSVLLYLGEMLTGSLHTTNKAWHGDKIIPGSKKHYRHSKQFSREVFLLFYL